MPCRLPSALHPANHLAVQSLALAAALSGEGTHQQQRCGTGPPPAFLRAAEAAAGCAGAVDEALALPAYRLCDPMGHAAERLLRSQRLPLPRRPIPAAAPQQGAGPLGQLLSSVGGAGYIPPARLLALHGPGVLLAPQPLHLRDLVTFEAALRHAAILRHTLRPLGLRVALTGAFRRGCPVGRRAEFLVSFTAERLAAIWGDAAAARRCAPALHPALQPALQPAPSRLHLLAAPIHTEDTLRLVAERGLDTLVRCGYIAAGRTVKFATRHAKPDGAGCTSMEFVARLWSDEAFATLAARQCNDGAMPEDQWLDTHVLRPPPPQTTDPACLKDVRLHTVALHFTPSAAFFLQDFFRTGPPPFTTAVTMRALARGREQGAREGHTYPSRRGEGYIPPRRNGRCASGKPRAAHPTTHAISVAGRDTLVAIPIVSLLSWECHYGHFVFPHSFFFPTASTRIIHTYTNKCGALTHFSLFDVPRPLSARSTEHHPSSGGSCTCLRDGGVCATRSIVVPAMAGHARLLFAICFTYSFVDFLFLAAPHLRKLRKLKSAKPSEIENSVAKALFDLEQNHKTLQSQLPRFHINGVRLVESPRFKKTAMIVFYPLRYLMLVRSVQRTLTSELEKRHPNHVVVLVAQRKITKRPDNIYKIQRVQRSKTSTAVFENILNDLIYPCDVVARRWNFRADGSKIMKVFIDAHERKKIEVRLPILAHVYKLLTHRAAVRWFRSGVALVKLEIPFELEVTDADSGDRVKEVFNFVSFFFSIILIKKNIFKNASFLKITINSVLSYHQSVFWPHLRKLRKLKSAKPSEIENSVAKALFDLEQNHKTLQSQLPRFHINGVRLVESPRFKKTAMIVFYPLRYLMLVRSVQRTLTSELEKRHPNHVVVLVAQRKITKRPDNIYKIQRVQRSKTSTAVFENILNDLIYPCDVVARRWNFRADGSKIMKVFIDAHERKKIEVRLPILAHVYKLLTHRAVSFAFMWNPKLQQVSSR
eukprot:gene10743-7471_t